MTKKKNRTIILCSSILLSISLAIFYTSIEIESKFLFNFSTITGFISSAILLFLGIFPAGVNFLHQLDANGPFGSDAERGMLYYFLFDENKS